MPKVSVIIPVYGVEKYIERCARSLFEQTLDDIEYLFVDDCTPDKSIEILKHILEEYPQRKEQVIIHRMEQNSGQAKVREWGMKNATGEYVIHCDSDDWVDVHMYKKMYNKAIGENADIVVCDYYSSDSIIEQRLKGLISLSPKDIIVDILLCNIAGCLWNKLVRRDIYFHKNIYYPIDNMGEDGVLVIQFLWNAKKISYLSQPLYYYFKNLASISNNETVEKIRQRFSQATANASIIEKFLVGKATKKIYDALIKYIFEQSYLIVSLAIQNNEDLIRWRKSIDNIKSYVYKNPYLSLKNKLIFYLLLIKFIIKNNGNSSYTLL